MESIERSDRIPNPIPFSQVAIMQNIGHMDYCRTSAAVASGCTAGILGLTGVYGFIFYFITAILFSLLLLLKVSEKWNKFFMSKNQFATHGLFGGLFTYILFWTFLYGMVHVY